MGNVKIMPYADVRKVIEANGYAFAYKAGNTHVFKSKDGGHVGLKSVNIGRHCVTFTKVIEDVNNPDEEMENMISTAKDNVKDIHSSQIEKILAERQAAYISGIPDIKDEYLDHKIR